MRVFVRSFGCSTNLADGAVLAGCLVRAGFTIVGSVDASDVVVYNTCAVKGPTENRMIEVAKRVPSSKKLVVAGCLPLINMERLAREVRFDGVAGPAVGEGIVGVVRRVMDGERVFAVNGSLNALPGLALPRIRSDPVVSIVPVSYGCLGSCAYCCVVFARGRLRSCRVQEIVERVKADLALGLREFWMTSQDVACYGRDRGTNLAELINALCEIEGGFKVRVGMMTPNSVADILDELVDAFRNEKVFKFVHLPVQSGDDGVLKDMNRFYSVDDFRNVVGSFRKSFPEITLATDVICGFPGEDQQAFQRTLDLIEGVKPDIVNVSKFFARPGTVAARMNKNRVLSSVTKERSRAVAKLSKEVALARNQRWVGWKGKMLVDERGKVSGSFVGRNFAYKPVVIRSAHDLIGRTLEVKIASAFGTYVRGEVVE